MTSMPKYAFNATARRNENERRDAITHMVRSVTKAGQVSKAPLTDADWRWNAFGGEGAQERAEARKAQLEAMNPNSRFTIVSR